MRNLTVLLILVVFGLSGYWWWQNRTPVPAPTLYQPDSIPAKEEMTGATKIAGERYLEYSRVAFEEAVTKRRVLFFYANWCPICRPADASFKQYADKIPEDVVLFRVNYNDPKTDAEEKALAQKYRVTYQHTFILVDAQGNEIKRWSSGGFEELIENLR